MPDLDVSPMAVVGRLSRAARAVEVALRRNFTEHGLDQASFDVLATLRRSGPPYRLTPGQLGRSAMVTSGAVTQRLDRLEAEGLVRRSPSASDRRVVEVELTDTGRAVLDRVLPAHLAVEQRLLAGLDADQRRVVVDGLRLLLSSVEAEGMRD
ncbi:MarR family winged helix-turn-helix transcriptional regulator [Kineococcus sp. NUM-3379]